MEPLTKEQAEIVRLAGCRIVKCYIYAMNIHVIGQLPGTEFSGAAISGCGYMADVTFIDFASKIELAVRKMSPQEIEKNLLNLRNTPSDVKKLTLKVSSE